jgi:hypothetical protein
MRRIRTVTVRARRSIGRNRGSSAWLGIAESLDRVRFGRYALSYSDRALSMSFGVFRADKLDYWAAL